MPQPLTITAHLHTPPIVREPILFDGVLMGGLGASMGAADPSGWVDPEVVYERRLPLEQVGRAGMWWYAASQATPHGPEATHHTHRRMPAEHYARWTDERSSLFTAGPDKGLRVRLFYRPAMLAVRWTCVGDRDQIAELLSYVPGIGHRTTHGFGQVARWEISEGGPGPGAYATDVRLRHIPASVAPRQPDHDFTTTAPKRLRPPYWGRLNTVPCVFVSAIFEDQP